MKPFDELTDPELVALTDEQIQRYVDLECAEAGVALLPDAPIPPSTKQADLADMTVYEVAGVIFTELRDAEHIAGEINRTAGRVDLTYMPGPGFSKKATPADRAVTVTPQRVFSENLAANLARVISKNAEAHKTYEEARRVYDDIIRKREKIQTPIYDTIAQAQRREMSRDSIRRQHARYMELADGRRRTAGRFLLAAVADAQELCPELFEFTENDPPDFVKGGRKYEPDQEPANVDTDAIFL